MPVIFKTQGRYTDGRNLFFPAPYFSSPSSPTTHYLCLIKCINAYFPRILGKFLHFSKRKEKCCWLLIHFIFRGPKIILCHQWEQGGILIYEYFIGICVGPLTIFLRGQITIKVCPQWGGGGGGWRMEGLLTANGLWFENSFHVMFYLLLHSKGSYWDTVRVRVE